MRIALKSRRASHLRRRGVHTVEIIIALPVIFIATLAVLEFGILFVYQQAVTAATIEAVRDGAKGGNKTTATAVANQFLQPYGITLSAGSTDANLVFEDGVGAADPLNANSCFPVGPAPTAAETRVTICLRLVPFGATSAWGSSDGVPNWLSKYGFSLSSQRFEISALTQDE